MRLISRFTAALLALLLIACSTIGHKFDMQAADQLTPGTSTMADATALLGKPAAQSTYANGSTLLQWQFVQGTALGTGQSKHLAILFGSDGKMIRVTHRYDQSLR